MSELPDPNTGWRAALLMAWSCTSGKLTDNTVVGWWCGGLAVLLPTFFAVVGAWPVSVVVAALTWIFWWRVVTAPRMPTVWESTAGLVLLASAPAIWLVRTVMRGVRGALEEAAEHDRRAGK